MFQIKRIPHIMREKKTTTVPSNLLFFDTETVVRGTKRQQGLGEHVLWFGWSYAKRMEGGKSTREVWTRFTKPEQFVKIVKSRCQEGKPLYVYAHNLGFDLTIVGFFEWFKREGFTAEFFTFDSPPNIFKCKWNKCSVTFVDTLNYWTTSLEKLGQSLGIDKLPMPDIKASQDKWDTYCKRDVEVIITAIDSLFRFVQEHECGGVGLTLASLSMNAFRHKHMKDDIYIHDRIAVCEMERRAYYGGFVNAFFIGKVDKGKIYNVDINSHYPAVMRNKYPTKLIGEEKDVPLTRLQSLMRQKLVIADVYLSTKQASFPVRENDKLCYCVGRYKTTLCQPELERALKTKSILKVDKIAVYEGAYIFRSFVEYFWRLRREYLLEEKNVEAFFCKILLNSLYGKFGQRGQAWNTVTQFLLDEMKQVYNFDPSGKQYNLDNIPGDFNGYKAWCPQGSKEDIQLRNVIGELQARMDAKEHSESFPAIAAFVTSYGREFLLSLITETGHNNCYYCDTDSLFVNVKGLSRLKKGGYFGASDLGKLKIADTTSNLIIRGLKDYEFGSKRTIKGIRKDAKVLGRNEFSQIRFEGIKGIIRRGGQAFVKIDEIHKTLKRNYDKGRVDSDGWTRPFKLG